MTNTSLFIKRFIKSAASVAKEGLGMPRPAPGSVNIIAYHRVVADIARAEKDSIHGIVISTATFRRHCEQLRRSFDVVSLETAMHFLDHKRRVARPMAVITFDDGYLDFYEEAFPVLNDLGLPATVFLPTRYVGQNKPLAHDRIFWLLRQAAAKSISLTDALCRAVGTDLAQKLTGSNRLLMTVDSIVHLPNQLRERVIIEIESELGSRLEAYPDEYRLLDWEMVREMARKGINFGSHTANHVVLPLEDESVIVDEITSSKAELEEQISKKVVSFAFPNGKHTARVRQMTANAGYHVAVTTASGANRPGADLYALGRTSLCEESTRGLRGSFSPGVANLRLGI